MPENLFAAKGKLNELFRDENALYQDYLPGQLPCREKEINEIVFCLEPLTKGKKPRNLFLFGPPGTGKTAAVRHVLGQLQEFSGKAKGFLVNCFEFNSRHAVLSEIASRLGSAVPRRGVSVDETFSSIFEELLAKKIFPVIVLDEADQLLSEKDGSVLLYELLRLPAEKNIFLSLIIVSNDPWLVAGLEERVRSSLNASQLQFEKYSPTQLKEILNERCAVAFFPETVEKDAIALAAAHAAKLGGDARIAIDSLLQAGRLAESSNSSTVSVEHLKAVFSTVDKVSLEKRISFLNAKELEILKAIARFEGKEITSGALYDSYSKSSASPLTLRRFRDIVTKLGDMHLLGITDSKIDGKGKTRKISLLVSIDAVLKQNGSKESG
jgi:cell division control protein 6